MRKESDIPGSVRIRTDDENEHRFFAIKRASDFYGCNRSEAVANACNDVPRVFAALQEVLERDDLTLQQRREIAQLFDREVRGAEISVDLDVEVDLK